MSIDLDSTEGRKKYLSEKLDDLLDGINDSYGTLLMEELLALKKHILYRRLMME